MKCPNCGYEHGWSSEKDERIDGDKGEFYSISNAIEMARGRWYEQTRDIHGCPSCGIIFIQP